MTDTSATGYNVVRIVDKQGQPIRRTWRAVATTYQDGRRRLCTITGPAETATAFCQLVRRTYSGADIFDVEEL
jgi:hypothetical protein